MTYVKQQKGWRMSCDVGKATELILQTFHHFTYVTTNSPTLPSLCLRHSSFFNPSVASPTSQFILQPFFCFSYVTSSSRNSPGEPPMRREPPRLFINTPSRQKYDTPCLNDFSIRCTFLIFLSGNSFTL